jgi:phosphohistidine phosphatase
MELIFVRHGIAADRETWNGEDMERPLTADGAQRFRKAARGLIGVAPKPQTILTSPATRASETARILADAWKIKRVQEATSLAWGRFEELARDLSTQPDEAVIALVGHEPHLSETLAQLVGSAHSERLAFKKGGAALVSVAGSFESGGRLVWLLPPRVLRSLA